MKTQKIIQKFKEIDLVTSISIQEENRIRVEIKKRRLDDPDLKRILKAFPAKKYDVSIKPENNNLILEISKTFTLRSPPIRASHVIIDDFETFMQRQGRFGPFNVPNNLFTKKSK